MQSGCRHTPACATIKHTNSVLLNDAKLIVLHSLKLKLKK